MDLYGYAGYIGSADRGSRASGTEGGPARKRRKIKASSKKDRKIKSAEFVNNHLW